MAMKEEPVRAERLCVNVCLRFSKRNTASYCFVGFCLVYKVIKISSFLARKWSEEGKQKMPISLL